jgi:adenosylhomocysteine nucleosidase
MLGFVVGLKAEARIAARLGRVAISGARPAQAADGIRRLIGEGATALVSFGLAGGLAPGLDPGDLVIATTVLVGDNGYRTDTTLTNRFATALPDAHLGAVLGSDIAIDAPATKRRIHATTGAIAVDMESQALAACGGPFAVLRAVADPHDRALPPAALVGIKPDGGSDILAVLASLLRAPSQLPQLIALGRDSRRALASLERAVALLGSP